MKTKSGIVYYLLIGISCGILIGLSLAPVIEKTLSILLTFVTTIVGVACGVTTSEKSGEAEKKRFQVDPKPFAFIMIGIVLGSVIGIVARNNNILGDYRHQMLSKSDNKQPANKKPANEESSANSNNNVTGLHADEQKGCDILDPLHGNELEIELKKLGSPQVDKYLELSKDSLWLEFIKAKVCHQ